MANNPIIGLPGLGAARTATWRRLLQDPTTAMYLGSAAVLDGSETRDPGNTGDVDKLRAGNVLGRITSSGLWVPAFVGLTQAAYTSGGTTLSVTAAAAVELDRLVGQSGTTELVCIGAPTAGGTVAVTAFTHSAINTSTGDITVTSLGVNKHSGAIVAVNDGRYTPLGILGDGYPIKVTDLDAASVDQLLHRVLIGGFVDVDQIINYPAAANTGLTAWLKAQLRLAGMWTFTDDFGL